MKAILSLFGIYIVIFLFTLFCLIPVYFIIKWATKKAIKETLMDKELMRELNRNLNANSYEDSKYNHDSHKTNNTFTIRD